MNKLINWKGLSQAITGSPFKIRQSHIPNKHKPNIEELFRILEAWKEGKRLYTEAEIRKNLNKIDLFAIYVEKSE